MQYEGRLEASGEVFDSTREDNTVFTFEVGQGKVRTPLMHLNSTTSNLPEVSSLIYMLAGYHNLVIRTLHK